MIQKTKEFDLFIFREDNREKIDKSHVQKIVESIRSRNLLEFRPIVVNSKMEILDGQHRVLAAKELDVEIYYQMEETLGPDDIIKMNISKAWNDADYLNFYCSHNYIEYIKLKEFVKKNNIMLKVAMCIAMGNTWKCRNEFRKGEFVFKEESLEEHISLCWETIDYIKKINGFSTYTRSSRFWNALLKLIKHPEFDKDKWQFNMQRLIDNFSAKTSEKSYLKMVVKIYNWKNLSPIILGDDN